MNENVVIVITVDDVKIDWRWSTICRIYSPTVGVVLWFNLFFYGIQKGNTHPRTLSTDKSIHVYMHVCVKNSTEWLHSIQYTKHGNIVNSVVCVHYDDCDGDDDIPCACVWRACEFVCQLAYYVPNTYLSQSTIYIESTLYIYIYHLHYFSVEWNVNFVSILLFLLLFPIRK